MLHVILLIHIPRILLIECIYILIHYSISMHDTYGIPMDHLLGMIKYLRVPYFSSLVNMDLNVELFFDINMLNLTSYITNTPEQINGWYQYIAGLCDFNICWFSHNDIGELTITFYDNKQLAFYVYSTYPIHEVYWRSNQRNRRNLRYTWYPDGSFAYCRGLNGSAPPICI